MGWSITPSDLASIDSNGHVTFSQHTERNITYTVTYSDANFTCSKSCTVYKCPDPCTCANANLNAAVAPDGIDIPASGYTSARTIGTYNSATCLTAITATSSENWITDITVGGGNIRAKATENESLTSDRTATITVTGKDDSAADCTDAFIVTQVPSASTCTCVNVNFQADATAAGSSIPASGYTASTAIGEYTYPVCLTNITASSDVNWVTITNVSDGSVYATVNENEDTDNSRSGTVTVSGVDAYGETCSDPFDVIQQKAGCDFESSSTTWFNTSVTLPSPCVTSTTVTVYGQEITKYVNCPTVIKPLQDDVLVTMPENNTANRRYKVQSYRNANIYVTQPAGPCHCTPSESRSFARVILPCGASDERRIAISYTATTIDRDCNVTTRRGSKTVTIPAVECNDGDSKKITVPANPLLDVTQEGGCTCVTYTCNSFTISNGQYGDEDRFMGDAYPEFRLLTINPVAGEDFFSDDSVEVSVKAVERQGTSVSSIRLSGHDVMVALGAVGISSEDTQSYTTDVYLSIGDFECKIYTLSRVCPCVTDNCLCGAVNHRLYVRSYYPAAAGQVAEWPQNSDAIIIEHGQGTSHLYDTSNNHMISDIKMTDGSSSSSAHTRYGFDADYYRSHGGWETVVDGWLHVFILGAGSDYNSFLYYVAEPNLGNTREATFSYYRDDNGNVNIIDNSVTKVNHPAWIGHLSCKKTVVVMKQAKYGYRWENTNDYDEYGVRIRAEVPIDGGGCSATLTLNDNLPADGGRMTVGSYTTNGGCTQPTTLSYVSGDNFLSNFSLSNGTVTATVAKNNNSSSTKNGVYRITFGTGTAQDTATQLDPTPTCGGQLHLSTTLNPDGAGTTSDVIGNYSLNSACSGNITVAFISGGGNDFLSNLTANNGNIYGTYNYNGTGAVRTGTYGLYVNGALIATDTAAQGVPSNTCVTNPTPPTYTSNIYGDGSYDITRTIYFDGGECYSLTGVSCSNPQVHTSWPPSGGALTVLLETTDTGSYAVINLHFKNNYTGENYYGFVSVEWVD